MSADGAHTRTFSAELSLARVNGHGDYYKQIGVGHLVDRSRAWGNKQVIHRPPLMSLFCAPFVRQKSHVRWSIAFTQGLLVTVASILVLLLLPFRDASRLAVGTFAVIAFLGSIPVAYYTTQIFPEVLTGSILLLSLCLTRAKAGWCHWLGYTLLVTSLWGGQRSLFSRSAGPVMTGRRHTTAVDAMAHTRKRHQ